MNFSLVLTMSLQFKKIFWKIIQLVDGWKHNRLFLRMHSNQTFLNLFSQILLSSSSGKFVEGREIKILPLRKKNLLTRSNSPYVHYFLHFIRIASVRRKSIIESVSHRIRNQKKSVKHYLTGIVHCLVLYLFREFLSLFLCCSFNKCLSTYGCSQSTWIEHRIQFCEPSKHSNCMYYHHHNHGYCCADRNRLLAIGFQISWC